jgi:hypothetical protein
VTDPTAASYLTIWPQGATLPLASNLNWTCGVTISNLVIAKLGAGGDSLMGATERESENQTIGSSRRAQIGTWRAPRPRF